jgi:hypothetical protein
MEGMTNRLKSVIASVAIQGTLTYALIMALAVSMSQERGSNVTTVDVAAKVLPPPPSPERPPPSKPPMVAPVRVPAADQPVILHDWSAASPAQRNLDFAKAAKWVQDNLPEADRRLARWREQVPQGSGPGKVTRLRPASLTTHTLYWPAQWQGRLPIIAWGNGTDGKCSNSSLAYAAFLSEIASHGYFVVAVGNDDIDYPQPEGIEILADGRPIRTQASALRKAVDWAVAENDRAGGPYAGRLDTGKIAYMGHACGAGQALAAGYDPRATTIVMLNSAARFSPAVSTTRKPAVAQFSGERDEPSVLLAAEANFAAAQAAGWPMYKAALAGGDHDGAYLAPDRRWSRAILAWLDWRLKADNRAELRLKSLSREGWSRVGQVVTAPDSGSEGRRPQGAVPPASPEPQG